MGEVWDDVKAAADAAVVVLKVENIYFVRTLVVAQTCMTLSLISRMLVVDIHHALLHLHHHNLL
jgi:hypothetical protein